MSRYLPTMLKVALAARDRECAVAGCNRTQGLEIDHIIPVEQGGPTTYTNLERKCFHDHRENKHRRGLDLEVDDERGPP
jgi:5-methylcytosine-specific restriction endonuclease McrA